MIIIEGMGMLGNFWFNLKFMLVGYLIRKELFLDLGLWLCASMRKDMESMGCDDVE